MSDGPKKMLHKDYWSVVSGLERLRTEMLKEGDTRRSRRVGRMLNLMHKARGAKGRATRVKPAA